MDSTVDTFQPLSKRIQLLVVCWLAVSAALLLALWSYEVRAGEVASIQSRIPDAYAVNHSDSRISVQLFVFVHPMCRCTVATLEELEHLLSELPPSKRPAIRIVVLQPAAPGEHWDCSHAESLTRQFDQTELLSDEGGRIAREFGAMTSGQIVAYGLDGTLLFEGGITLSRGHRGPAPGQELLRMSLLTGTKATQTVPVFGCALSTPE